MAVVDIIHEIRDKKFYTHGLVLWPQRWREYNYAGIGTWHSCKLVASERANIPKNPGIYTLIIKPGIADHPACSYLMYVGKTISLLTGFDQFSLWERSPGWKEFLQVDCFDAVVHGELKAFGNMISQHVIDGANKNSGKPFKILRIINHHGPFRTLVVRQRIDNALEKHTSFGKKACSIEYSRPIFSTDAPS